VDRVKFDPVIPLGHSFGVEGVERQAQLNKLKSMSCDFGQGYL
jgi:EAL domain-containing protein (putative c-di-GMP-specific phosphodiesterase class I)